MGTVNDILTLAHAQLGNDGSRYWNWYTDNVNHGQGYYVDGSRTPYCAEYISWLLAHTDTECIYFPDSCAFDARDIKESDRVGKFNLKAGDIVAYDWDSDSSGDHVGLVVRIYPSAIVANEGNCNGYVRERYRPYDDILFGIRPKYDAGGSELDVDGIFGALTISKLQESLQSHGYYKGCIIDGDFGYYTVIALQQYLADRKYYLNCLFDGLFRYYSVLALQRYLADLGYYTESYMRKIGHDGIACLFDGDFGEYTVMSLQTALNDDRF